VAIALVVFMAVGVGLAVFGVRMLRDPAWGVRYLDRTLPKSKLFRGTLDTTRKVRGVIFAVGGVAFAGIGLGFLISLLG
jgi:hypothetical protein